MSELTKNSKNSEVVALLKLKGITIGATPVIIDIRPTKTVGKSTVFCIAEVDLGEARAESSSIEMMSSFELIGQAFTPAMLMRGKMTVNEDVIKANALEVGSLLELSDNHGEVMTSCLRAYESREKFYREQQPIGYKDEAGAFIEKLKDGKPFYRDSKIVAGTLPAHQLL